MATLEDVIGATKTPFLSSLIPSFGNGKNDIAELARLTGEAPSELSSSVCMPSLAKIANLYLVNNYSCKRGSNSRMNLLDDTGYFAADKQKKNDWTLPKANTLWTHFLGHGGDIFDGIFVAQPHNKQSLYMDQLKTFQTKEGQPSKVIEFLISFLKEKIDEMAPEEKVKYLDCE